VRAQPVLRLETALGEGVQLAEALLEVSAALFKGDMRGLEALSRGALIERLLALAKEDERFCDALAHIT
jgi:hypothetical protein